MTIEEAEEFIRKNWDDFDGCGSCSYKSAYQEHEPFELEQKEVDSGVVHFPCFSEDASENGGHRGIKIYLRDAFQPNEQQP